MMQAFTAAALLVSGFVSAQGADFFADGKPFRFVGANLRVMHGSAWRERYLDVLGAAARDGLRVGRVWALGEGESDAETWRKSGDLFRAGPEGWVEGAYQQLDRVLAAARSRNIRLIITLANHWGDYGGAPQYLRWLGIEDLEVLFGTRDRFYSDPRARALYAAHLDRLLARRSSVDGTPYVQDPAIFAWELINESHVETEAGQSARRDWIAWASARLKARDTNHLVGAGLYGYKDAQERADWIAAQKIAGIDYCDAHLYPQETLGVARPRQLYGLLDDLAQVARYAIGKPLVIGEFGFPTRAAEFRGLPTPRWFELLLSRVRFDGIGGALAWIYQPRGTRADDYAIFIDDPSAEPIRQTLARAAAALTRPAGPRNPLLSASQGDRPLTDLHVEVRGTGRPLDSWRREGSAPPSMPALALAFEPTAFARARWEQTGEWKKGALVHAWGLLTGFFEFRFRTPPGEHKPPRALTVRIRLSSEYPGSLSPPDGTSAVTVRLDGTAIAKLDAFPDDGEGRWYTIRIDDPHLLGGLSRAHFHVLRLEVIEGPRAHGLCIYGSAGEKGGVADAGPARLTWEP